MKKYSSLFVLWFSITNLFAQSLADSLKNALKNAKTDTAKVSIYAKLTTPGIHIIPQPEIVEYSLKGYELAKSIGYKKGQIVCGLNAGFSLAKTDSYKSLIIFFDVKKLCEQNNDILNLIKSVGFIGYAYNHFDIPKSLQYYKLCLQMMQKNNLQEDFIPIYAQIGFAYKDGGMPDSALVYVRRGYQSSLKGLSNANPKEYYRDFGEIYYKKGNNDSAMYHFRRSITAFGNNSSGQTYLGIARIMRDKNQIDSAKVYAKEGLKIFQKNNYNYFIIDCAQLLYDLYKDTDAIEAQKYRLIVLETKDKLYDQDKAKQVEKLAFEELEREMELQIRLKDIKNRNRFYALLGILGGVLLLSFILYRNNRQKQKANKILENTLADLKTTQAQLIQSEKLASLGELTAGIAHEIQNPLNFVNNFSELSVELLEEMETEFKAGKPDDAFEIAADLKQNLSKINHHGKRASSIVKGMLEHSRSRDAINRVSTDLNALADEYLRLAYHGLRAKDISFNATLETHFDPNLPLVSVIPQDIGRVLLNLINNAFYAVAEKANEGITGYQPTITVSTKKLENAIEISVKDNGSGIPEAIRDKIFQPFFTTKPTGQGTGLGLSLAYDIVTKGHGGTLDAQSTVDAGNPDGIGTGLGSEFTITLPIKTNG